MNSLNDTLAALELTTHDLNSILNLDFKLNIIPNSLHDSLVVHQVPFILVRLDTLFKMISVNLETSNLFKHRTNILMNKFINFEPVIKITISVHHVSPEVKAFTDWLINLFTALILDKLWIETTLRYLDKVRCQILAHFFEGLLFYLFFGCWLKPSIGNTRD